MSMSPAARMRLQRHHSNPTNGLPVQQQQQQMAAISAFVQAQTVPGMRVPTNKQHLEQLQQLHSNAAHFPVTSYPAFQMASLLTSQHHHHHHHKSMTSPEPNLKLMGFEFSQKELDMVLYGYARGSEKENQPGLGLALSGLRIGELSYGMYS